MRRSMTWPWSSTRRGRFWSWGEATTMPHAWKEPWWAPSAQPPPPMAPEWGQARETPQETTGRRAGHWTGGGEGVALWPSVLALLTWRCRCLLQRGAGPRALGCEPAPGTIWDSPFKSHEHLLRDWQLLFTFDPGGPWASKKFPLLKIT